MSDQLQWNVRRVRIEDPEADVGQWTETVPRDESEKRTFSSEDALRAAYGSGLLLPGSFRGVYFVSAAAWGEPGNALIRCEYRVNKKPLILEIDSFSGADSSSYDETSFYYPRDFTVRRFSRLLVGEGADCCFVYFINGGDQYVLTGGQGTGIVTDIAQRMIKQRRGN